MMVMIIITIMIIIVKMRMGMRMTMTLILIMKNTIVRQFATSNRGRTRTQVTQHKNQQDYQW